MSGEIELAGYNGDVVIGYGPLVIVLTLIEVYKISRQPEVPPSVGVVTFIEFFLPFCPRLPTNLHSPDFFVALWRKVHIEGHTLWHAVFQYLFGNVIDIFLGMGKVCLCIKITKAETNGRIAFNGCFNGRRHGARIQHTDGRVASMIDAAYYQIGLPVLKHMEFGQFHAIGRSSA